MNNEQRAMADVRNTFAALQALTVKSRDGVSCIKCKTWNNVHREAGYPDYLIVLYGRAIFLEVKAAKDNGRIFRFQTDVKPEQWVWYRNLPLNAQAEVWIWLQFGTSRPNTTSLGRQVYLMPITVLEQTRDLMRAHGLDSLPANWIAAQETRRVAIKELNLHAENILSQWALEWQRGHGGAWRITPRHEFYKYLNGDR